METGYEVAARIGGLLGVARAWTGAYLPESAASWYGSAVIGLIVVGCGLIAGLYRSRYMRGSRDEVAAVALADSGRMLPGDRGLLLGTGRRAALETILGGAALPAAAMLGARYLVFVERLRPRTPDPTAVKIIVFGARDAGTQLIHGWPRRSPTTSRRGGCNLAAFLWLSGHRQLAEIAASTGGEAGHLGRRGSGRVIRDLTVEAERCGLVAKVTPSVRGLLRGVCW